MLSSVGRAPTLGPGAVGRAPPEPSPDARKGHGTPAARGNKAAEDVLGLAWSYGGGGVGASGPAAERGSSSRGSAGQDDGRGAGKRTRDADAGEAPRALDWRPPAEAHPDGYQDGSVPVPAPSKIYLRNAVKYNIRGDGSMPTEDARQLQIAKVRPS